MKRIPIAAAKRISQAYGCDQVVIIGLKAADKECPELYTDVNYSTYGINKAHCKVAGDFGKWISNQFKSPPIDAD